MHSAGFALAPSVLTAVEHVGRMRGEAQAHLMRCSDGDLYVVKFKNNPQHIRILFNELLCGSLARALGLPVPDTLVVEVSQQMIRRTTELTVRVESESFPCASGLQFGSRYVVHPLTNGRVFDYLPREILACVGNLPTFPGALAFDKWVGNVDRRQATFWRTIRGKRYTATFIDYGHSFNAGEWDFPDRALQGTYPENLVYADVTGWDSFEPWLSRIENMTRGCIEDMVQEIPLSWSNDRLGLSKLVDALMMRRHAVRDLIGAFRTSIRQPFPLWCD